MPQATPLTTPIEPPADIGCVAAQTAGPPCMAGRGKIPALDGVRGLAILMVMLFHMNLLPGSNRLFDYINRIIGMGWTGVDLFFVLSGFLITGILYDAKGGDAYFRSYFARRVLRIFPLYYVFLVLAFYVLPGFWGVDDTIRAHQAWYWLYASNIMEAVAPAGHSLPLSITWSLAVEEQFYLIWPTVVLFLSRQTLLKVCVAAACASMVLRIAMVAAGVEPGIPYSLTPCRLEPLMVGAFIALWTRGPQGIGSLRRPMFWIGLSSALVLAGIFALERTFTGASRSMQTVGYTCLALLFGGWIVAAATLPAEHRLHRFLTSAPLRFLGKHSYSLYLFHLPVSMNMAFHVFGREQIGSCVGGPLVGALVFYALTFSATIAIALVTWYAIEQPFLKLKRLFPYGAGSTRAAKAS